MPRFFAVQELSEFQGVKRTCQRALDSHNARRRKREEAKRTASPSGGEGGGTPPAQRKPRDARNERQQRSGSGGSTGSASGQGGSPRQAGGSSAHGRSGTTGGASLSRDAGQQGGAAAVRDGQQGPPSSTGGAAAPAAAATPSAPSSLSQPVPLQAVQQVQAVQQPAAAAQQALAAAQQPPAQLGQAGWQQQSLGTLDPEPSCHLGQPDDSSMMVQYGSGSLHSGAGQTQPSSSMHPTGSGQTQPSSSPYAAPLHLGGLPPHSSGFYPPAAALSPHSNGFTHVQAAQQLPAGWPAAAAAQQAPQLQQLQQPWGGGQDAQLAMSMPMLHMASNGAVAMPGLAAPMVAVPQPVTCLGGGGGGFAPMPAAYAPAVPAGLAAPMDGLVSLPEVKTEVGSVPSCQVCQRLGRVSAGAAIGTLLGWGRQQLLCAALHWQLKWRHRRQEQPVPYGQPGRPPVVSCPVCRACPPCLRCWAACWRAQKWASGMRTLLLPQQVAATPPAPRPRRRWAARRRRRTAARLLRRSRQQGCRLMLRPRLRR